MKLQRERLNFIGATRNTDHSPFAKYQGSVENPICRQVFGMGKSIQLNTAIYETGPHVLVIIGGIDITG